MGSVQDKEVLENLIEIVRIRMIWINSRIKRWVKLANCFRCQQFGHRIGVCKPEDRAKSVGNVAVVSTRKVNAQMKLSVIMPSL